MHTRRQAFPLALALGLALATAGCGSQSGPAPQQVKAAAPVKKAATPADSLSPYLVSAVTTGKNGATMLQVKYELASRADVGDTVDLDLVLIPQADNIDSISGTVQAEDGLEVVSGGTIPPAEKPVFGTPIHEALKVRAKRDGIFSLSVAMTIQSGSQTLGPVYSMPIIAGNGLVDAGVPPAPAQNGAKTAPAGGKPAPTATAQ
jgi:hypothetical protein